MTLREWQQLIKPVEYLLFNCSDSVTISDAWVPYPIGLCLHFRDFIGPVQSWQIGEHENTALLAIHPLSDKYKRPEGQYNRSKIIEAFAAKGIANQRLSIQEYFTALPHYKFVISPPGNGIDCHRHYEAIIAGCIPIVEEYEPMHTKYGDCPILYTRDYSEITPEYLEQKYTEMLDKTYDFSRLFLGTYNHETQIEIMKSGNYWCNRFKGHNWYMM